MLENGAAAKHSSAVEGAAVPMSLLGGIKEAYGFDLVDGSLVVVRAWQRGGSIQFEHLSGADKARVSAISAESLCAASLSPRECVAQWIEAPFSSIGKARAVMPSLLDLKLPFPLEDCESSFAAYRRTSAGRVRCLAMAARRSDISKRLETLRLTGADPGILDAEGSVLWSRSVKEIPAKPDQDRVLFSLQGERCVIVTGRGAEWTEIHGAKVSDALQIRRVLIAALGEKKQVEFCWAGPGAADRAMVQRLEADLRFTWQGQTHFHADPARMGARALAARALEPDTLAGNLRTGAMAHALALSREAGSSGRLAWGLIAASILIILMESAALYVLGAKRTLLDQSFDSTAYGLAGEAYRNSKAKGDRALEVVRRAVAGSMDRDASFRRVFEPSILDRMEKLLNECGRKNMTLESLALTGDSLGLRGKAPAWQTAESLLAVASELGYAAELERKEALAEGKVAFEIKVKGAPK
jgi:hypothetical protein